MKTPKKKNMNSQKTMSSSSTLITIMALSFLFFSNVNAQHCTYKFDKLVKQRNITKCKKLRTLDAEFAWNYHNSTNSTTTLEILFGAYLDSRQGWMAWGVNPGKRAEMIGTKAIIGIKSYDFDGNPSLKVDKYDITKETKSGCSLLPSNFFDLNVSNMSIQDEGSNFYTIYAKLVLPSDEYNIAMLNHVWQIGNALIDERPLNHPTTLHNVDSTETINLTSPGGHSFGQRRSYLRSVHGVLNIIGWGTLLPIGVIIARYFKVAPFKTGLCFPLHIGCQLTGFLIGTAGWVIGLVLGNSSRYYTFHTHRVFGILIFTFSTIQMLAFRLKPKKKDDDYRKYWNMYHHFLGYGLLTIIIINIFKGITILNGGGSWRWSYIGILICLSTIAFGLEVYTWIEFIVEKWPKKHNDEKTNKPDKDNSNNVNVQNQK